MPLGSGLPSNKVYGSLVRLKKFPLDSSSFFNSEEEYRKYLMNDNTAYIGQPITIMISGKPYLSVITKTEIEQSEPTSNAYLKVLDNQDFITLKNAIDSIDIPQWLKDNKNEIEGLAEFYRDEAGELVSKADLENLDDKIDRVAATISTDENLAELIDTIDEIRGNLSQNYYTKTDVDTSLESLNTQLEALSEQIEQGDIGDLEDYYKKSDFTIADYATIAYVNEMLESSTGTIDGETLAQYLTNYYKKSEVDTLLLNYVTKTELETTLDNYYTKTEIDSELDKFYTKEEVNFELSGINTAISNINTSLSNNYYTKNEVDSELSDLSDLITQNKTEVDSELSNINDAISGINNNLTQNYYTKSQIDSELSTINNNISQNYYTKSELDEKLNQINKVFEVDFTSENKYSFDLPQNITIDKVVISVETTPNDENEEPNEFGILYILNRFAGETTGLDKIIIHYDLDNVNTIEYIDSLIVFNEAKPIFVYDNLNIKITNMGQILEFDPGYYSGITGNLKVYYTKNTEGNNG